MSGAMMSFGGAIQRAKPSPTWRGLTACLRSGCIRSCMAGSIDTRGTPSLVSPERKAHATGHAADAQRLPLTAGFLSGLQSKAEGWSLTCCLLRSHPSRLPNRSERWLSRGGEKRTFELMTRKCYHLLDFLSIVCTRIETCFLTQDWQQT